MSANDKRIHPEVAPSGTGCVECLQAGGWWLHLRRCAECGHIGCCDNSPHQHATWHFHETGHAVIRPGARACVGACSRIACALMPPNPNEFTAARRGAPGRAIHGDVRVLT